MLVMEATKKSGTQITASYALDQGRDVFALPGRVWDPLSAGCLEMIRDGAQILTGADQVLEALNGKIDGLLSIKVVTDALASSNADMMLDSCFESAEALAGYQVHPLHKAAANGYVRPFVEVRLCLDFEE